MVIKSVNLETFAELQAQSLTMSIMRWHLPASQM